MASNLDEQELVKRLQNQDEAAFAILVRTYQAPIFRLAFRMLRDRGEAEELSQEVFITAYTKIGMFRGDSKLKTWLYRVATNQCINRIHYLNRRGRKSKSEYIDGYSKSAQSGDTDGPDAHLAGNQLQTHLEKAISMLSDEHRTLIILRDIEGMPYDEIQDVTELELGTIKSRLHRARSSLRSYLTELENPNKGVTE